MSLRIPPIQEDKGGKKKAIFIASSLYYRNKSKGSVIFLYEKSVIQYAHVLAIQFLERTKCSIAILRTNWISAQMPSLTWITIIFTN